MARSNKFSTLNLNEIYGNKPAKPAPSSDSAASAPPRPRSSGGMLVLSRPVKKETPQLPLSLKSQTKKDLPEPSKTSQNELTKAIQPIDPIHGSKDSQEQIKHIQIEPTKTINPVNQIQALEDSKSQNEPIKTIQPFDPIPGLEDSQEEIIQNGIEPTKSIKANNQIQASKVAQEEIPKNQKRSTNQEIPNVEEEKADVSRKNSDGSPLLSDGILILADSSKSNRNEDLGLTNKNDGEGLNSSRNEDAGLLSVNISLRPQDINEEKEMPIKEEEVKEHEKLERKAEPFRPPHLRGGLISSPQLPPPPPGKVFRPQQYKEYDIEVIRPSSGGNSHQLGNRDFGSLDSGYGGGRGDSGYGGRGNSGYGVRGDSGYGGCRGDSGYGGGRGNSGYGNRGRVVRNPGYDNQHPRHDFERYGHRGRFDRIEDHNYRNVQGEELSRDWYGQEAKHYPGQEAKHYMENNRFRQKSHRFYDRQAHERDNYGGNKHFYRGGYRQPYGGRSDEVGVGVGQEYFQRPRAEGHERSGFRPGHVGHEGECSHQPIGSADSWRGIQKSPSHDQGHLEGNQGFSERNQRFQEGNLARGIEMHGANVRWKKHSSEAYGNIKAEEKRGCPSELEPVKPVSFVFLTYNVWFANLKMHERMKALGELIEQHQPHFICLQEVTPDIYAIFLNSSWWSKYTCSVSPEMSQKRRYFCIQLSKLKVKKFSRRGFRNTIMGRELCMADVDMGIGEQIVFATTHLESPCPAPPTWNQMYSTERVCQMMESLAILNDYQNVIFGGDMNWDDGRDGAPPLPDGWYDAWSDLKSAEDGWTYDTKANQMLSANRSLQKRLDRILCSLQNFEIETIDMIGKDPIPGQTYKKEKKVKGQIQVLTLPVLPSDHFGLLLKFKRKEQSGI